MPILMAEIAKNILKAWRSILRHRSSSNASFSPILLTFTFFSFPNLMANNMAYSNKAMATINMQASIQISNAVKSLV